MARRPRAPRELGPREQGVGIALVVVACVLWLWPLPLAPASTLLVEPDPFLSGAHEVWLAWLLRATPWADLSELRTRLVMPPEGVDLRYYHEWLTAGAGALISALGEGLGLARLRSLVLGVNLAHLTGLVLSALAVQRSARALGASRAAEALAVTALLCSPLLRGLAALANPEQLWVGLVLFAVHEVVLSNGHPVARGLRAGLWGLLAGLATRYLFLGTAGALAVLLVGTLATRDRRASAAAGLALLLLGLVGLFLGWPQLMAPSTAPALELARPVVPTPLDLLLPTVVYDTSLRPAVENHAYSTYVGLTLLVCATVSAVRGGHRERLIYGTGLALLVAGLGWQTPGGLPLPLAGVAAVVPVIENLHAPHRFVLCAQLLFAALVGLRATGHLRWVVAVGLIVEGAVAARGLLPFPVAPLPSPPALLTGAGAPDEGALAELVSDEDLRSSHHMEMHRQLRQLVHGRPLLQMPSWPGGGVEPAVPGLDRAVRRATVDAVHALPPDRGGRVELPAPSPLAEAALRGLRWVIVLEPPDQARMRLCELPPEDRGTVLLCSAPGAAE